MRKFTALLLIQLLITVSAYADENLGTLGGTFGDSLRSNNSITAITGNNRNYLETTINRVVEGNASWGTSAWRIQRKVDVTKMGYIQFGPYWDDVIIFGYGDSNKMVMDKNGNFGIGTDTPQSKLAVNGIITAKEVKVTTTGWSDYVFEENYELKPLDQVEAFIQTNKHLPDIPSEKQIKEEGLAMADMMAKQMAKIEELTLYLIEQDKKMSRLVAENEALKKRVDALEQ